MLKKYAEMLTSETRTDADRRAIESEFIAECERKLTDLKKELHIEKRNTLLSKEVLGTVAAVVGAATLSLFPSVVDPQTTEYLGIGLVGVTPVGAGLAVNKVLNYYDQRKQRLKANPMGWLCF